MDWIDMERNENTPLVIMMCGVAGSGKTTFAKQVEKKGFVRLSIDEEIWATHGRYGIDYPMDKIEEFKIAAENKLRKYLVELVQNKQQVVIDFSFWNRKRRDEYKQLIEQTGGKWELIYLKVDPVEVKRRIKIRNEQVDANAFPVSEEILQRYMEGFEVPVGEGELVLEN